MPTICVAIQKGGVGKTSGTVNFASYLALHGKKTLIIDFDPQANTTTNFDNKFDEDESQLPPSLKDVIMDNVPLTEVLTSTNINNLDIIPSNIHLAKLERYLMAEVEGYYRLRDVIEENALENTYDYIFIDTPPGLGMLTLNALVASKLLIIPVTCEKYSVSGLQDLLETVKAVKKRMNPEIEILGAFINKYDHRRRVVRGIEQDISDFFGDLLFNTRVRFNTRIEEAILMKTPIFLYDRKSIGTRDFEALCKEIVERTSNYTKDKTLTEV